MPGGELDQYFSIKMNTKCSIQMNTVYITASKHVCDELNKLNGVQYLSVRWHRTKIDKQFSSWQELTQGVSQGYVLGPLLFNIYLNDLFYLAESTNVCNFADDTSFYACDKDLNSLKLAIEWFENNSVKLNRDKCHLLVSGFKYENVWANIGKTKIWESEKQKRLGVEIDRTLNFDEYIASLCKKAGNKLSVLARLSNFMCTN